MFDKLGLIVKERRIATGALVSIASGVGIEFLIAEVTDDKALLQESSEIIFSDEDMEVGYSDHRRPIYLVASINQIPIKRALVDTSTSVNLILLSTLQAARISKKKDSGMPNGSNRIMGKRQIHRRPHLVVVESGTNSLFGLLPRDENGGLVPHAIGKTVVA